MQAIKVGPKPRPYERRGGEDSYVCTAGINLTYSLQPEAWAQRRLIQSGRVTLENSPNLSEALKLYPI